VVPNFVRDRIRFRLLFPLNCRRRFCFSRFVALRSCRLFIVSHRNILPGRRNSGTAEPSGERFPSLGENQYPWRRPPHNLLQTRTVALLSRPMICRPLSGNVTA